VSADLALERIRFAMDSKLMIYGGAADGNADSREFSCRKKSPLNFSKGLFYYIISSSCSLHL
jgi:hypothetical protein